MGSAVGCGFSTGRGGELSTGFSDVGNVGTGEVLEEVEGV